MTKTLLRAGALTCALLTSTALTSPARAQDSTDTTPARQVMDANGVDVASGQFRTGADNVAIADLGFGLGWTGSLEHDSFDVRIVPGGTNELNFYAAGQTRTYSTTDSVNYTPRNKDGSKLVVTSTGHTLTLADGTIYTFVPGGDVMGGFSIPITVVDTIASPDGRTLKFHYRNGTYQQCNFGFCQSHSRMRLQSIIDNQGHMLKPTYASQSPFNSLDNVEDYDFRKLVSVKAIDLSVDYCDPAADTCTSLTKSWPTHSVSETAGSGGAVVEAVTDQGGNVTTADRDANGNVTAVDLPANSGDDTNVTYDTNGRVSSLTRDGLAWTYSYSETSTTLTTTASLSGGGSRVTAVDKASGRLTSETDELSRTTSYQYDTDGRITRITHPEGNYTSTAYDARGNVTEVRHVAKSGSGLSDIVLDAGYDSTCSNVLTCNKPNWTEDALNNRTDYTYSSTHGGLTRVQLPAPTSGGTRPEINYTYTALYGRKKNSSGTLVAETVPVYKVTQITRCATAATCSGTANETVVDIAYDQNNLLPTTVTTRSGNSSVSSTVTAAYDDFDRVKTVDGPLSGTADTTRYYYDSAGRLRGTIGPDPDGGSSLLHRAIRYSYNAEDQVTEVERGTSSSQSDSAIESITVLETVDTAYDGNGRKLRDALSASGTTHALTQLSYDSLGRLQCTAVRMNPNEFAPGSLPSSACTLDTEGSFGADRITKNTYDNAGQLTLTQSGYGVTGVQADEVAIAYTNNGKVSHVTDGEGNRTTYEYDGHDRLVKTRFPSPTTDNTSSTTDYEQLTVDANGNVTAFRNRANETIGFTFNNLGRMTQKDRPGSELDVTYGYDLLGRMTSVSQTGYAISFTWDALGRRLTETGPHGTISSSWDDAGRRTRLTHPDGFYVDHEYLATGEMTKIKENGATSGAGVLATFGYDNLGRRSTLTYGNGAQTGYSYDGLSRLTSLAHDTVGTGNDATFGMTYNPAGQIATRSGAFGLYAFTGHANANSTDTHNGLNQITANGGTSLSHDARGNTTAIGNSSYSYSSDNLLLTAPGGIGLFYDPLNRLRYVSGGTEEQRLYDGLNLIVEYNYYGTAVVRRYVHGPAVDEPLVWYEGSGTSDRRFLHADERGSIIGAYQGNGNAVGYAAYDDYGWRQVGWGDIKGFGYTGQVWLPEVSMWYYKARIYNPNLARFMQPDPIGYGDGMNMYAYVGNDPVNRIDPLGLAEFCWEQRSGHEYNFIDENGEVGRGIVGKIEEVCRTIPDWAVDEPGSRTTWGGASTSHTDPVSFDGRRGCGPVPPAPPGVNIQRIIRYGEASRDLNSINKTGFMFMNFRNDAGMDFKQIRRHTNPQRESPFVDFGNFAFGAFSYAINLSSHYTLVSAGIAQVLSGNALITDFWSNFDDPEDQEQIMRGRQFAACMLGH